ncbi:MAG: hypothetical protein HY363_00610 [Candidatus Aenigmarchaeota archaeon]|nr:hypothetical protein [Candidatus Aenigmarchaeota archaeon]
MNRTKYVVFLVIGLLLAVVYVFLPPKMIIAMGLGILRHNDRVLIGTIGLIAAFVCGYKLTNDRNA